MVKSFLPAISVLYYIIKRVYFSIPSRRCLRIKLLKYSQFLSLSGPLWLDRWKKNVRHFRNETCLEPPYCGHVIVTVLHCNLELIRNELNENVRTCSQEFICCIGFTKQHSGKMTINSCLQHSQLSFSNSNRFTPYIFTNSRRLMPHRTVGFLIIYPIYSEILNSELHCIIYIYNMWPPHTVNTHFTNFDYDVFVVFQDHETDTNLINFVKRKLIFYISCNYFIEFTRYIRVIHLINQQIIVKTNR